MSEEAMEGMSESEASLTEDLKAAWDAVEGTSHDEPDVSEPAEPTHAAEKPSDGAEGEPAGDAPRVHAEGEQKPQTGANDNASLDTPPKGLPADAREVWKGVPEAVKKAIVKREQDYERGIVQYAQKAQHADQVEKFVGQFNHLFQSSGAKPFEYIGDMLQVASQLTTGTKQAKAEVAARLIQQFDIDIYALDHVLSGSNVPPQIQQQDQFQQMLQQEVAPLKQELGYYRQQTAERQQRQIEKAQSDLHEFANNPANEFWQDVKGDVQRVFELASAKGQKITLEQAYNTACLMNPEIANIIESRKSQQAVSQKRQASTSIYGTMGGEAGNAPANSVREAIEMAWENAGRM